MEMPNPSQPKLPDYYDVLGVDLNATTDEVSRAFRQRARHVHPDKQDGGNVNDWHKAYTTLMNNIKRQEKLASEDTEGEPDYSRPALPTTARISERFKQQFGLWMETRLQIGECFSEAFNPELEKMLRERCEHLATSKSVKKNQETERRIETECNFEEMMASIAGAVQVPATSHVIRQATQHVVRIIRAAQTSKSSSEVTGSRVPILDLSGSPVSDLLFLLNIFASTDELARTAKSEDILRRLMAYIPVTDVQVGMFEEAMRNNFFCANCTSINNIIFHICVCILFTRVLFKMSH